MTMYKCEQCAEVWSKGPMRDAILEGWTCPVCLTAKLQAAEATNAKMLSDWIMSSEERKAEAIALRSRAEAAEEELSASKKLLHPEEQTWASLVDGVRITVKHRDQLVIRERELEQKRDALQAEVTKYAEILTEANTNRMGMIELNGRLQAEVARLREEGAKDRSRFNEILGKKNASLDRTATRIVELEQEVARMKEAVAENNELGSETVVQQTEIRTLLIRIAALEAGLRDVLPYIKCRCDSTERSHNQIYWDTKALLGGEQKT